jgi:type I restriction enzyme S subunit
MKKDWTYKKLGEVAEIYQPKTLATSELIADGKYLVYGANGVIGRYNEYNHKEKEILVTCRGATCGTINISEPYSWINGNAMVVHIIDDTLLFDFLKYSLKHLDWTNIITGAAQPQITRQNLSPAIIPIPPLSIQRSIVAELDLLHSVISKKKEQLRELDNLAQSLFYQMFGDPITNPMGWEIKKLGEVGDIVGGSTPKTSDEKNWIGTNQWVSPAELKGDKYFGKTVHTISDEAASKLQLLPKGTVLLSSRAPIGKLAITTEPMYCNQGFKNIICGPSINNEFVYGGKNHV